MEASIRLTLLYIDLRRAAKVKNNRELIFFHTIFFPHTQVLFEMNYKKMSSGKKRFVLFCLLSLFAVCSPVIFAQDKNRQISSAESQSVRTPDGSEKSTLTLDSVMEKIAQFGREKHGGINISDENTLIAIDEFKIKSKYFDAPDSKPDKIKGFLLPKYLRASFVTQSGTGYKINAQNNADDVKFADANFSFASHKVSANDFAKNSTDHPPTSDAQNGKIDDGFRWRPALQQAFLFLAVQHGYAMTQPKTREALKGKFFRDYVESVKSLRGWEDGGRFFTNYIAHPMQGSFLGFIQIQNDPKGMKQRFGSSGDYWRSRMKAMAWSAAWSTQFEIGPISQASIGNVGLKGKQTYIDIVITPTVGTAMLITEDALDRFIIERIERATDNYYLMIFSRTLLNPTRTVANLIRFKIPWHRDRPRAK